MSLHEFIIQQREKLESKAPSSTTLFNWTYATLVLSRLDWQYFKRVANSNAELAPSKLFPARGLDNSFEFTRVRFRFIVQFDFPDHVLIPLGERLFQHDMKDVGTAICLLNLYQPQHWKADNLKGDHLVEVINKLALNERRSISAIAQYYFRCWIGTKSKADANQSISRLEKLLATSKCEEQKVLIKRQIEMIRKGTKWN